MNWMKVFLFFCLVIFLTGTVSGTKTEDSKEAESKEEEREVESKENVEEKDEAKEKERVVEAKERIIGAPVFANRDVEAPFVVKFQINDEKNTKNCTGVQITSKHLLSSANCLDFLFDVN